jgi:hypothetical protein
MRSEFPKKSRRKRAKIFERRIGPQIDNMIITLSGLEEAGAASVALADGAARQKLKQEIMSSIVRAIQEKGDYIFGPDAAPKKTKEEHIRDMVAYAQS